MENIFGSLPTALGVSTEGAEVGNPPCVVGTPNHINSFSVDIYSNCRDKSAGETKEFEQQTKAAM